MSDKKTNFPVLLYNTQIPLCRIWADYWKDYNKTNIRISSFVEAGKISNSDRQGNRSIELHVSSLKVTNDAYAVILLYSLLVNRKWLLWLYEKIWIIKRISDWLYHFVLMHEPLFSKITIFLYGESPKKPTYNLVQWLFLKVLGLIYLIAFISFGIQMNGLIGSEGILPAGEFLQSVVERFGFDGYRLVPTIFWVNASNIFMYLITILGILSAICLIGGILQLLTLIFSFVAYLSLVSVGQVFMSFQWDVLLLEIGFLAIFLPISKGTTVIWLFRWLLFRLMFLSGIVKILSGDPTWRNLTALNFHYETQPLPNFFAWYVHQLPEWFQVTSVAGMFTIELVVPFLIFAPRRLRVISAILICFFQLLIILTGNYNFFNLLAIGLCLFLLDDVMLRRLFSKISFEKFKLHSNDSNNTFFRSAMVNCMTILVLFLSGSQMAYKFLGVLPESVEQVVNYLSPLRIVNSYGLFSVMTTSRPEIIVEGSNDAERWYEYDFKYKPGDLNNPPGWVAPHQPRLDWQMWFAALGNYQRNRWFVLFMIRLLEGSTDVLNLLDNNPFPNGPPRYVRALLYHYHFTDNKSRIENGAWWKRELKGIYLPEISLTKKR